MASASRKKITYYGRDIILPIPGDIVMVTTGGFDLYYLIVEKSFQVGSGKEGIFC